MRACVGNFSGKVRMKLVCIVIFLGLLSFGRKGSSGSSLRCTPLMRVEYTGI